MLDVALVVRIVGVEDVVVVDGGCVVVDGTLLALPLPFVTVTVLGNFFEQNV